MRVILFRSVLLIALLGITWALAGRQLSLLLDRVWTIPMDSLPTTQFSLEDGLITVGEHPLSLAGPVYQTVPLPAGFQTPPEAGDQVSLRLERSVLSWPTPLQFNFMTGHSPSWKRHLYYRLRWMRRSGASLELLWRYEQWYYSSLGRWSGTGGMTRQNSTGLIKLAVTPAP